MYRSDLHEFLPGSLFNSARTVKTADELLQNVSHSRFVCKNYSNPSSIICRKGLNLFFFKKNPCSHVLIKLHLIYCWPISVSVSNKMVKEHNVGQNLSLEKT